MPVFERVSATQVDRMTPTISIATALKPDGSADEAF